VICRDAGGPSDDTRLAKAGKGEARFGNGRTSPRQALARCQVPCCRCYVRTGVTAILRWVQRVSTTTAAAQPLGENRPPASTLRRWPSRIM